jgi:AcrR family transcriptional regulator
MAAAREPVSRRARPAKTPLSRRAIVQATARLIRERGVDAVSLRDVAQQVETGAASLYAYFANRDVLLEHVLDEVYGEVVLVDATDGDWRSALAATIVNTIEALARHPGLGAVALGAIPTLPGALRLADHELALMGRGGVPESRAALAVDLISQFVAATATERTLRAAPGDEHDRDHVERAYRTTDPERFPHVARAARALVGPTEHDRRDFAIGVIIAGLGSSPD